MVWDRGREKGISSFCLVEIDVSAPVIVTETLMTTPKRFSW